MNRALVTRVLQGHFQFDDRLHLISQNRTFHAKHAKLRRDTIKEKLLQSVSQVPETQAITKLELKRTALDFVVIQPGVLSYLPPYDGISRISCVISQ